MSRIDMEDMLDRYLKGEASPGEVEQVDAWLDQHHAAGSPWQRMDKITRDRWLASLFRDIEAEAGLDNTRVLRMHPGRIWLLSLASVAAVIFIVFTVFLQKPSVKTTSSTANFAVINIPAGQKKQVLLADGSKIEVNSLSVLKYPLKFDAKTREVYLSGEAYFDIQHDASKPFIIHTGKVVTTVLGTAFNIKEDKKEHTIVVTVTRGKVSVANGNQPLGVITPNQQISFNEISLQHSQKNVDAEKAIAWLESNLHFNNVTFADAANQLQQRFKVNISFANDKVKNCRFTGTAIKAEKLDEILNIICMFNNATYKTRPDGSIVIDGPGCN
ncbi:FecR family protein [Mucilaginibacter gotjawali]|uniref:Fec operon regulator FecR n=2 Tax=Mucilaginibacter gotjawali TaxID=1550579 RepID=A0A110B3Y2_9SPHI|nr:FecR family protein [Mucilaginibacter gotjawali]MBB3056986.1 ferric-dicitrate binding protein FerR (iron transport regulator) [Mucilaginibacter gotjawali]BAU56065.1 fec operon regulator FecR [Mucilaginibacter gotjawali]